MSFGKLYSYAGNPRTTSLLAVAKENGLDIEFVDTEPAKGVSADYLKLNKLGKVPTFEGADGFVLSECIAIAVYLASQNEKTSLLGKTKQDYATILRWMSFANTEVLSPLGGWFRPILGRDPYNKKNVEDSQKAALKAVHVLEEHLFTHTYLVGERLTLADLFAASIIARGFQYFFDKKWRDENPNVTRWYETVYNQTSYSAVAGKLEFITEALKNVAPKKEGGEKKKEQPKAAAKPKAAEPEEDDEPAPAPKPKHPLESLPRATFVLDDWKRKYSNEETREVALPWFWENANFEEYSIYKVDYKYNDELTLTFMTANLIGGFFARLEGSRKYIFGACSVYGEANNSIIKGAFIVRGQEALPAFDVAPDYESYEFTKLDPSKPEDKEFVNDQWSWDKPITVDGKTYEWADGKGSGGGPSEDNVTGFLVRSTATKWSKNSVIAVDAGSHLAAITRILAQDFPLVSNPDPPVPTPRNGSGSGDSKETDAPSPGTAPLSDDESGAETPISEREVPVTLTTLQRGAFAGLPFPHASARANALHVVREHISTYLITHPHLDHVSGFVINTAAFHNTSRPKRLAALPFTVNAIKTHIFNNVIWPNLTDEDGGVGLVTFQRLAEGGNIALGEGSGRGFIEVCDGLGVKGFKVSHGHCMRGPGHVHRGSNANLPETPGIQHTAPAQHLPDGREGRSLSFSLPTQSAPGTPGFSAPEQGRRASGVAGLSNDHCVIDSTAYFIRADSTSTTPKREVLIFGDVEPDSLSLSPRTALIWAEAAPKIAAGILRGIFIEVSYTNAQADAVLFGHLAPRHLLTELKNLAEMVKESKREHEREKEEVRKGRKRKRASNTLLLDGPTSADHRKAKPLHLGVGRTIDSPLMGTNPHTDDEQMTDYAPSRDATGTHTPNPHTLRVSHPSAPAALNLSSVSTEHSRALLAAAFDSPLKGVKVVVIHVKDSFADGLLMGDQILRELQEGEEELKKQGRGLGCVFEVSRSGESYWF
ncbi:EF1G-domain-containing protein [Cucurbitaria berberidis CBS 394.84]|uniref:EF1G-domain-containing protein n=1 Tax=Cucurbitaria berberidis CBS 394.84 TaxID=1168544 RepID=A0A9P4GF36_9PLEO|nr:EF1G-domain-containing protein [Cucurbitaria berberidis CBS 394.84]KAF1844321.1 EF1G-domain-containing protein [Cucurbitaria berberidis CBS 394.84]